MTAKEKPKIALPKGWTGNVRSAVLHVIGLAQYATVYTRSWAANSPNEAQSRERSTRSRSCPAGRGDPHQGWPTSKRNSIVWLRPTFGVCETGRWGSLLAPSQGAVGGAPFRLL
jgi:hypothetical protein